MLAEMLAPVSLDQFFNDYWTRQFLHLAGPSDKFEELFSWDVLNHVLETHRFTSTRLRLVKAGADIEAARYLVNDVVDAARLKNELANGATLALNFCEEVHPPLKRFAVELGRLFHVHVNVNLYAGWRKDNGFNIHWDDQDTLILQVSGRKHWKVWAPTRAHPFKEDIVDTSPATKPETPPVWEGELEQGAMFSMPRGWWHVAYPMDEPCLHLTITIKNLNGIDFLRWFAHRMKSSEAARQELPIVATREAQRAWLQSVLSDITENWKDDLLDRFLKDTDDRAFTRPAMQLPEVGASFGCDIHTPLELALPYPLRFQTSNGAASFHAAKTDWNTTTEFARALERFNDGQPHTLADVAGDQAPALSLLATALLMQGVVRPAAPALL